MPSILTRLKNLVAGPSLNGTPAALPPADRLAIVQRAKAQLDNAPRRERPASDEKVPQNYGAGIAGQVWFLPHQDSATKDSAEIRAAMRLMPRNPYVKAAWWTQILSVASQDGQMQAAEPGNTESEEQAKAAATMLDAVAGGKPGIAQSICTPLGPDGFTVAEKVWGVERRGTLDGKIVLKALKDKDPDDLRIGGDKFGNVTSIKSVRRTDGEWPIEDFVFVRYLPVFNEPLGMAAFRAAYGEYWMLDTIEKLRAIHHEKKMAGMLVGTYADDETKGPLETALRFAKTATWMAIPEGTKVEAVALSTASEPDYKSFVESKQTGIVTGISGAALQILQGTVPDARGDTKVQKQTSDLFPWLLTVLVQEAVTQQIVRDFIDFNYPYAAGGYPRYTLGGVEMKEMLEILQLVEAAGRVGFKLSKKHYARHLSLQQADPNDPEDAITPPAAGGMGGMQGGPGAPPGADPFAFGEDFAAFGWQAAQSRTGTTKAIGTGENAGSVLYGTDADTALAGKADDDKPNRDEDDDRDEGELKRLESAAASGDIDAGVAVHRKAQVHAEKLLADPSQRQPIDPKAGGESWKAASTGLGAQHSTAIGTHLATLTAGPDSSPGVMRKAFSGLVGAIKAAGALGVKAVGAFLGGIKRQLGPYGWWAGSLVAAAAIMAAPAAAAGLGLVGGWMALATTPGAAVAALSMRKVGAHLATKSAVKNWGYGRKFGEDDESDLFEEFADGRGFTGTIRDRLGREYRYVDGKRVADADETGKQAAEEQAGGGFGALEKGPDVKAREIGETQHARHGVELAALASGRGTPEQVLRRVGALRADVARTYGAAALESPEWKAVESHFDASKTKLQKATSDSAEEARSAVDDFAKGGKVRKGSQGWLDEHRDRAAKAGNEMASGLPGLFAAFKAKHRPVARQGESRFGERVTAVEVADALVHRFGWTPGAVPA